jgi:hypothetical protein
MNEETVMHDATSTSERSDTRIEKCGPGNCCNRGPGRLSVSRRPQFAKRRIGIVVRCDGASNVMDDNLEQYRNAQSPRVDTEEGTVKEAKLMQQKNAYGSISRIVAGDSKVTIAN